MKEENPTNFSPTCLVFNGNEMWIKVSEKLNIFDNILLCPYLTVLFDRVLVQTVLKSTQNLMLATFLFRERKKVNTKSFAFELLST